MMLEARQSKFVDEYLLDLNGAQAAIRAGYGPRSARVQASRLLSKANIKAVVAQKQAETAAAMGVTRERVVAGLLDAFLQAKLAGQPATMICAMKELAKLLGFYPEQRAVSAPAGSRPLEELTDGELVEIVSGTSDPEL